MAHNLILNTLIINTETISIARALSQKWLKKQNAIIKTKLLARAIDIAPFLLKKWMN